MSMEGIQIWKGGVAGNNFIDEIKNVRDYCIARYGFAGGLKETKELIDSIYANQAVARDKESKFQAAKDSIYALNGDQRRQLMNYFGWTDRL